MIHTVKARHPNQVRRQLPNVMLIRQVAFDEFLAFDYIGEAFMHPSRKDAYASTRK